MKNKKFISTSSSETVAFGKRLAKYVKPGDIICFDGDLGSGKTTLIKGIAKGLGIKQAKVNSPTFVLMNIYEGKMPLFHFDLYRLNSIEEIYAIGYDEFLYGEGLSVIEWADRLGEDAPEEYLKVSLQHYDLNERIIQVLAKGVRYQKVIENLGSEQ